MGSVWTSRCAAIAAALFLVACDDATSGGAKGDAGSDAVAPDAVAPDSGAPDSARPVDASAPPPDAAAPADGAAPDAAPPADAGPADAAPDAMPDVGAPDQRLGRLGEPCPRGAALDCDAEQADQCVFVGDNEVLPGVTAVCSRACDEASPCGAGLCCLPGEQGGRCLPAGFCAQQRAFGAACADDGDCPPEAPLCATESNTGAHFCTTGCAAGGACPEGFCCDSNAGGRPRGAICKATELCPVGCEGDADCAAVEFCEEGACVPRAFTCEATIDCPQGEQCVSGVCEGETLRLGEDCDPQAPACGAGAPVCATHGEDGPTQCTYTCTFHRDCPATYCCADLAGLGDRDGLHCTNVEGMCPPNLPCRDAEDCAADQFCYDGICTLLGTGDVERGAACELTGDCVDPETMDCVFMQGGILRRGERAIHAGAGAGACMTRCTEGGQCGDGECCRLAFRGTNTGGVGFCTTDLGLCDPGPGTPGGAPSRSCNPSRCDPALFSRCMPDRFFGEVCSAPCERGCPDGWSCDDRDEHCHPPNVCDDDARCGVDNRCEGGRCVEGARQCVADADCGELVSTRCAEGRCMPRARPCGADAECDESEVCFDGQCELAIRPCAADLDCRFGEACVAGICDAFFLDFGAECADQEEFGCDPSAAPICYVEPDALPGGMCTHGCEYHSDCGADRCCIDTAGLGDPQFFVCAPDLLCDQGANIPRRRPCQSDDECLAEDFCHRGLCEDRGAQDQDAGGLCQGAGDCNPMGTDQCVVPLEFGFGAGAIEGFPSAVGPGRCEPTCDSDGDCGGGCCRHALERGEPVAFCVQAEACLPVAAAGEACFPGAHDECDPATSDACVFSEASEQTLCAAACSVDADCGGGCCADTAQGSYCLPAAECP